MDSETVHTESCGINANETGIRRAKESSTGGLRQVRDSKMNGKR